MKAGQDAQAAVAVDLSELPKASASYVARILQTLKSCAVVDSAPLNATKAMSVSDSGGPTGSIAKAAGHTHKQGGLSRLFDGLVDAYKGWFGFLCQFHIVDFYIIFKREVCFVFLLIICVLFLVQ